MSCLLSAGIAKGCKEGVGGVKRILLANKENYLASSGATEGYVDSITMSATTKFYEFKTNKFSSSWTDTPTPTAGNSGTAYVPTITMNFAKNEASKRNQVKILGQAELVALVQNSDETWWLVGKGNGLELGGGSSYNSGVAITDANQWVVQLTGGEIEPAVQVDPSIIAALL